MVEVEAYYTYVTFEGDLTSNAVSFDIVLYLFHVICQFNWS
jgi:hypothetical protein